MMRRALELAGSHRTHPNPRVGAVVVDRSGQIVGEGSHHAPGMPHAEIVALAAAGERARGSTVYVTLEPCSHEGRTPPCAGALVDAGVSEVVIGAIDPDPRVLGAGVTWLERAGIAVETGLLADEAEAADPAYFHHRRTGLPLVTLKGAMTLDGSVGAADGSSQWITSEAARADAHALRAASDAVVIGAGTLLADDPLLTARHEADAYQPVPVVVAGRRTLPTESRIWKRSPLVVSSRPIGIPSGEVVVVPGDDDRPDPVETARALADRGLLDVMLEGGPSLARSWWHAGLINRGVLYVGAMMGGGRGLPLFAGEFSTMAESMKVKIRDVRMVGSDIRIEFASEPGEGVVA